ncbi:MAG: protein kinase, partial [Actinomycetota bacterium]
ANRLGWLSWAAAWASAHVYLAGDRSLGRQVAVKCLRSGLNSDERFRRRFRAEAQAAAQLSHPNLLAVYDWGEDPNAYLVTELLMGGTLLDLLARTPKLSPSQGLLIALQAAQGLQYAHDFGIVHRDIKPANLLFGEEGRLRIADFGIARAVAEAAWTEPEGVLVGTARYAAPEQALGDAIGDKTDVYSLALTVIEAVTGRVPLLRENALATMVLRQDRDVVQIEELGALGPALLPAGRADPEARPSAAELIEGLTEAARNLPRPGRLPLVSPVDLSRRAAFPARSGLDGRRRPAGLIDLDNVADEDLDPTQPDPDGEVAPDRAQMADGDAGLDRARMADSDAGLDRARMDGGDADAGLDRMAGGDADAGLDRMAGGDGAAEGDPASGLDEDFDGGPSTEVDLGP